MGPSGHRGDPSPLPFTINDVYFFYDLLGPDINLVRLLCVADPVRSLQVVPVLSSCSRRVIAELAPLADWTNLINDKRQWMLCVAWLVVVYRPEPTSAYTARASHRLEACPVFSSQIAILMPWVCSAHIYCQTQKSGCPLLCVSL